MRCYQCRKLIDNLKNTTAHSWPWKSLATCGRAPGYFCSLDCFNTSRVGAL